MSPKQKLILKLAQESGNLHERVRRYAIGKLAQQLFSCVECEEPRAETDWFTAECFLCQRSGGLSADNLVVNFILAKVCEQEGQPLHKATFNEGTIRKALADDSLMDECLGRLIWDRGYQKIKHSLPRPPYGRILFH